MYDTTKIISTHQPLTASTDEFGTYGSVFAPDSDYAVPAPENLYSEPRSQETTPLKIPAASTVL